MTVRTSPADLLKARLRVAEEDLTRGIKALESLDDGGPVPRTVRDPLRDLLEGRRTDAQELRLNLGRAPAMRHWVAARVLGEDAQGLLRESLACLEASFVRERGLDVGLCSLANRMLRAVEEHTNITWRGTTIVGGDERFVRRSQLIHLRFPEFTLWALPLAAHEFGHLVAQEQSILAPDGRKIFDIAEEIYDKGDHAPHYGELFADAFAAWALGPAYACTSILLRFAPDWATFAGDGVTHPPDGLRVAVTLGVLEQLSWEIDPVAHPYQETVEMLGEVWEAALEGAGVEEVGPDDVDEARAWIDTAVLPLLKDSMPRSRYASWGQALGMGRLLAGDDPLPAPDAKVSIADVLNGAWAARLRERDPGRVRRIEMRARKVCGLDLDEGSIP
jgi:hypothetical protein